MTEVEARELLRRYDGVGGLEVWISLQHCKAAPDGWSVAKELEDWHFTLAVVPEGIRLRAAAPVGGAPAVWVVPGKD